ncbi:MAG: magnesium chelatase domain-containing protein, partial [Alphaproteobacteria bacterium]
MVSHVNTVALNGIAATTVDVQVQLTGGAAGINIVGLPDNAVKESRERVRGAFHALGLRLPAKRITVNLAPADLAKEGSHYDLPIAVAVLMAMGILPADSGERAIFMGELGLDGSLSRVPGCLPAAIHGQGEGLTEIFLPVSNAPEAAWAGACAVYGAATLQAVMHHILGEEVLSPTQPTRDAALSSVLL